MAVRLGFLSTYPSTQCGIATFCEALVTHLQATGSDVGVVRLVDHWQAQLPPVVHQWAAGDAGAPTGVADALNTYDIAVIQHEYGIFPGPDGEALLQVLPLLTVPVVSILHTVLTEPSANQRRVLEWLVEFSTVLVTMTQTARDRLIAGWGVEPSRIVVIPHGATDNRSAMQHVLPARPTVLTWGLLSEGKGIEWALRGLSVLRETTPLPAYRIVGETHPRVLERDGEAYRESLVRLTHDLDLDGSVTFDGRYLSGPALRQVVREADVVLLPYDSRDQVTSGVLTEAVVAGKPVISTSFPHAVELLSGGAGILVPQRDPVAIAAALAELLTTPGAAGRMAATSRRLASSLLWPAVATRYLELGRSLLAAAVPTAV
ncbi:glycosyltransferase [Cellulomonas sp. NTE-D12]|uniref:glycosyltransferase n=1 Tax=Cellulomonas sp. NTE-D12 TaxID=2962632 RepID=UPI00308189B1|nr:glycosyl transferase family 1 [Cellulomonas sp. NTE-D12]